MIFQPTLARAVADGRKTQTRRPVRNDKPCRYKVGHDYAVQPGRGKEQIARLKVLEVREEPVGAITHPDAKAEGFRNVAAFKAYWVRIHDAKWLSAAEDPEQGRDALTETELLVRFNERHAHKLVHVITFITAVDMPRFLASPGRGSPMVVARDDHGNPKSVTDYTSHPGRAIDDLEVVDERTLARYAKTAEAFCIGRQLARKKEFAEQRGEKRKDRLTMLRRAA